MGMFDFKRYNGFTGNVPQHFIDNKYPKCPMCRTTDPHGPQKDKVEMLGNSYLFRCEKFGCILLPTVADATDFSKSKLGLLTTVGMFNAIGKKASGKAVNTVYMREEVGSAQTTKYYEVKELLIEELQALVDSLYKQNA